MFAASDWQMPTELPDLRRAGFVALDVETKDDRLVAKLGSGWPFKHGYVCGISVAWHIEGAIHARYFPLRHPETDNFNPAQIAQWLRDLIASDTHIVTQNGGYDWGWLCTDMDIGMPPAERLEEIGALATLVDENRLSYALDALCAWRGIPGKDETLLKEAVTTLDVPKRTKPTSCIWQLPARFVGPYAEQDAASTLALFESLNPVLDREGTRDAYRLEVDLLPMVHEMRRRGIRIDMQAAENARDHLLQKRDSVFAEISAKLGANVGMAEIGRNKWLAETFDVHGIEYPRTKKGSPSFTAGTTGWMHKRDHWLPQLIVKADKLNNAAVNFLQGYILDHVVNARIHAEVHPFRSDEGGTRSLRFSYSDPPLQLMPSRDPELTPLIRGVFLPEEGEVWAKPDISQQEFRFIAHYGAKHNLTRADQAVARYRDDPDTDFHKLVAEMTGLDRQSAKGANFAKVFGAGIGKFATMIDKPEKEARTIYDRYDHEMPFVSQLARLCQREATRHGFLRLYDGARRHWENWEVSGVAWSKGAGPCSREEAERRINDPTHPWHARRLRRAETHKAMNALIQGSAARHTKLWMRACWREGIVPLLQMHDALDCSVATPELAERVAQLGCDAVNLAVPIRVDLKYGRNWGDAVHSWNELHRNLSKPLPPHIKIKNPKTRPAMLHQSSAMIEPDREQIELFTAAMFRHAGQTGFASLRAFYEDENKPFRITPAAMKGGLSFLNEVAIDVAARAANAPRKVVFCPPIAVFSSDKTAREQDIAEGLALSVECDQRPQQAKDQLESIIGPTTVTVCSGGTWIDPQTDEAHDKMHLHWRLRVPSRTEVELKKLKQARDIASRLVGGDPSNDPICHPIRWPGSWHRKHEPRLCQIATLDASLEIDLDAALAALEKAAAAEGLLGIGEEKKPAGDGKANGADHAPHDKWEGLIAGIFSGENFHNAIARLAMMLLRSGMNDGAAVNMLRGWMNSAAGARDDRWQSRYDDIPRAVSTARAKIGDHAEEDSGTDIRSAEETLAQLHYGTGRFHSDLLHFTFMSTTVDLQLVEVTVNRGFNRAREVLRDAPKESEEWRWGSDRWSLEEMCYSLINKDHSLAGLLPPHLLTVWNDCVAAGLEPRINGHLGESWRVVVDKPAAVAPETTWPTPYSARKACAIPRRLWLWGQHYMRGVASITAAPGAAGKSQHSLVEAVGMAAGRDLITGETKKRRLRVWVWNAEDDVDEMERRVSGICDYYSIDRESLHGYLFLDSGYELPFEFASGGRTAVIKEAAIQAAADQIAKRQIDVVIFDPLISVHSLSETDQTNLAKLLRVLGNRIAKSCNCALEIVHHTRKAGKGDDNGMTTDDIRGAGSIVYVPRSGRLLHPMSANEAEKYGISPEDRPRYVRLERAKPNMAKRGTIYWLHLVVWDVGNDGDGERSDTVTVPVAWAPKAVIDSITDAAVTTIVATIGEGEFRRDRRAGEWAGKVVAQACKLDISKPSGKAQATSILDHLITTGALATVFRKDKQRKTKEYVVPPEEGVR